MSFRTPAVAVLLLSALRLSSAAAGSIEGQLTDPRGMPVAGATLRLTPPPNSRALETATDSSGRFVFEAVEEGTYRLSAASPAFVELNRTVHLSSGEAVTENLRFLRLISRTDSVTVMADAAQVNVESPDPAEKVFAGEDLLGANPGRPGAPVSIPGYPVETASSGIKAPQYFAPGVAGDHGEPIAQYIQVGGYLLMNNLSANAHGNGYTDPNIYIASAVESVAVDGGAFNVREGNHALNLAATYALRPRLDPFLTFTVDQRDITATGGFSPSAHSWIALEISYGNGFLDSLEHRKQLKLNSGQVLHVGAHTLTMLGIGYYGFSYLAGLSPIHGFDALDRSNGWTQAPDTIDPRQKDQTHTTLVALNDEWKLGEKTELQLSGFLRTYNLSLYSDFGDGLIRQSEFRTVTGGSVAYRRDFARKFTLLAGTDYVREAPRRDDLDSYNFYNPSIPSYYGPFVKLDGNNITIAPVSPYIAGAGALGRYFRYYLGWRRDEIGIDNEDLVTPGNSSSRTFEVNSPKASLTFFPQHSWWAPEIAASFGRSFFTEDPRAGLALPQPGGTAGAVEPVETARSYQLVAVKRFFNAELKVTLGHETQTAEYGKIDPDTGLQSDLGAGRIRYMALTFRQNFSLGSFQATFEQADARDVNSGQVTPEAPRLIGDFSWTYRNLPGHLEAKGEFEYVGRKVVGNGCDPGNPGDITSYCPGVPDKEFRVAVARPFLNGKINVGLNAMLARGYTGQTTENFAVDFKPGSAVTLPVPDNPVAEVVGVRIPSYASVSLTYRFGR